MDWYRIKHTIGMYLTLTATKRASYLRKNHIFRHMGNNCMTMFRKIPLYPKLISFGDNVWIASNVTFITHDVVHRMINNKFCGKILEENVGCIEIRNNVFIGANTTILPNVVIGENTIVGACSMVNKNLRGGVYAGVPAKYICSIEEYMEKRQSQPQISLEWGKHGLSEKTVTECWNRFRKNPNK